ncbi:MAG: SPOR domain-containing protein [Desulfobacterales bacterium]|nr:SPOR domain-containing protein [Desulfobacterales bacterium]
MQQATVSALLLLLILSGCGGQARVRPGPPPARPKPALPALRYAIQAGAFKNIDNAVRLTERLLTRKLAAYHFIDESGFYKVRPPPGSPPPGNPSSETKSSAPRSVSSACRTNGAGNRR